jgi:hypothetical protein
LPVGRWNELEPSFSKLGPRYVKPVREAFDEFERANHEARERAQAQWVVIGREVDEPPLDLTDADRDLRSTAAKAVTRAMSVVNWLQKPRGERFKDTLYDSTCPIRERASALLYVPGAVIEKIRLGRSKPIDTRLPRKRPNGILAQRSRSI